MSSRIFARTLMSSIETGSSATSRMGFRMIALRDHRALLLAAREVRRVLAEKLLGGCETDSLEGLSDAALELTPAWRPCGCAGGGPTECFDRHRGIQ